ncbi:N-glycosylase [Acrasis kona]|uniref:DNA-(apurinic or apyrimidinic site) lyase n=1 Tax=Acrasis kona TaxID=1008807 RepID=A0AAW2ZLG5_9EUKA
MKSIVRHAWNSLRIPSCELRLDMTLLCGQVFTWQKRTLNDNTSAYFGVIDGSVVEMREEEDDVLYRQLQFDPTEKVDDKLTDKIRSFFNYSDDGVKLKTLFKEYAEIDPHIFARIYKYYPGVRVITQDPFECLICFICSANNNVSRITLMITRLCQKYGSLIGELNDSDFAPISFFRFPNLQQLSTATEQELRDLGFGYRAKYIVKTVRMLIEQQEKIGSDFLMAMRNEPDRNIVIDALCKFQGVGCKVASCIALYSLEKFDCVPLDVHVLRLARIHYTSLMNEDDMVLLDVKGSVNAQKQKKIMDLFVSVFGKNAGWAQMVLYGCQLAAFKTRMPEELRKDIFTEDQAKAKELAKKKKKVKKEKVKEEIEEDEDEEDEEIEEQSIENLDVKREIVKKELSEYDETFSSTRVTRSRSRALKEIYCLEESPQKKIKK